jgi:outer membrane biosynthesis protein TonB
VPGTAPIARVTPAETAQPMRGRALTPVPARPSQVMSPRETPWPDTLAPPLEAPRAKPPWVLYALVACGLLVGAIGLWVGLRRTEVREVTVAPAPAPGPAAAIPAPAPVQKVAVTISADAPGARVTFRRRVSNAPFTLEVAPTDIVELVEVSAPNRKTVRYWLTIDRATTLHAKLPKGAGNTEATEEETLVALGEAQLQAPAAVAAAPEAPKPAAAKPVKASAKPSPRKIGKAVAVVDDAPAPAVDAPAELAAEAPAPEPAADTAPAPAPAPAPDAAAAAPASLEVAKAAPAAVEVKPPAPKPIEASVVEKTVTAQVMAKNRPDVVACYQQAKKDNGKLKGSVTVSMTVDASGAISRPQVNSTLGSPTVAACILKAMRSWKFPARAGAPTGTASYKFALQ